MIDSFITSEHWAYTLPATQYPFDPNQGQDLPEAAAMQVKLPVTPSN